MSETGIQVFNHNAMATQFQVRIAGEENTYAAQTAQAAFALVDELESKLSRFRANSEISQIAQLAPGGKIRLTRPVFDCLRLAQKMEFATRGAFSVTASALKNQPTKPLWALVEKEFTLRCDSGRLEFDLGAIGKGFARSHGRGFARVELPDVSTDCRRQQRARRRRASRNNWLGLRPRRKQFHASSLVGE